MKAKDINDQNMIILLNKFYHTMLKDMVLNAKTMTVHEKIMETTRIIIA